MRKLVLLLTLLSIPASGEPVALTEKAARYHSLLLKRPKPGAIYERFASAWLEDGDIASLRTFLEGRAISAQATTADRLVLGFFLSQQSEHDAAINVIAKALEADPANSEAWLLRAQTEARVSKHAEALKSLEKVQGASGDTASEAAKLKARLLARSGQTAESLGVLKALATAHLDDEDLQDEVVELHLDEGLQGEAIDFLKALLVRTKDPYQRVVRRLRLGDILKSASNRDEALAAYSQCLDDAAQDSWVEGEVLAQIEQTFRSKDDLTGLKSFLEKLAEKQSQRLALGQLHARVLLDLNEADAAILAYRDLLKKHPGNLALSESFIEVLVRAQKFEDAVVQCRELLVQRKGDKELRIQLATLLYQARQPGDAIKELQPLIADAKTPEFELMRVARLYESFEHADDARKLYQRAVDSYPASITAQDALASYMHAHKEQISAVSIWKKQAVAPAPKEEVLRVARALSSRGEHEAALEVLQAREKEFPDDTPYLTQLISIASSAQRPELASGWAMTLVKLANDGQTLADALRVVRPAFRDPDLAGQAVKTLQSVAAPSIQQRCLLAELLEQSGDPEGADKVLASAAGGDLLMAQRQQARLYVIRQDYEKAASTLEQVASGGNDVGVIEEIVGLYQRASLYDRVLKWIGEWKQALPGSTRPWLAEARTLQAQQKSDQAVAVLKQAARKFSDDVSMATALAEAYVNNSQQADAQRIYQQLYDEAEDLPAQIRWAGQLAESAQRRGTLKELLESFQERQRGNRTSIAPWLAIAEIHRRTRNYEGRRTAMLEASRLKPKDIDLLHQIARVDEEQGDWRKAIETLATAASLDKSDKSRHRMAEVHLRYGDEETGLRMIFELGGGGDMDPRDAEGMIVGLMARGNWKMALTVIAPLLTRHPEDYRLRYLKLVCHLEDDSVDAAINEAVVLMGARVEVLTPSKSKSVTSLPSLVPEQMDPVEQLVGNITAWSYQALRYRDELRQLSQLNRYFISSSSSGTQYSFVPSTVDLVKPMVTALLVRARYEHAWPEDKVAEVVKQLAAAGHPVAQSVQWFELGSRGGPSLSIILAEVEKNIGNAQLVGLWMNQLQGRRALSSLALSPQLMQRLQSRGVNVGSLVTGSGSGAALAAGASPERKLLGRIYEHYLKLRPLTAASAAIKLWQTDDKDSEALDKAVALAATVPVKDQVSVYTYTAPLGTGSEPAALRTPAGRKLRDAALLVMKRYAEAHPAEARWLARAPAMHAAVGDWEAFVTSLNDAADDKASPAYRSGVFFGGSISFQPISSYHIMSAMDGVPYDVISALMMRSSGSSMAPMAADDAKALAAAATKLKDPNMRAIVAWRTEDKAAIKAYAQQQMEGNNTILWPLLVMASEAAVDKPAEAVPWLIRARTATTQRDMISTIDAALVHSVTGLISDKKMDLAKPYLAAAQSSVLALRRAMATSSSYELEQLASAMEKLGMKDEAERQRKALAAVRQSQRSAFSSMASTTSDPYQLSNDIRNGKGATAIPQVIRALRALAGTLATGSSYNASYEMRRWTTLANDHPAAAGEMWQQLNSSPAITLKQKLERAVLADILGREEVAIGIYSEAVKTKPRDAFLRLRLAMLQLRSEEGVKIALENLLAVSPADISNEARSLNLTDGDTLHLEQRFNLARLVTLYLQQVKSKAKPGDLDWCAKTLDMLMSGNWSNGPRIPNMLEESPDGDKEVQDTLAKREVLFDEFCKVAIEMPDLAHHILPALFALARHRKQDTGDIIQRARVALTGLAAAQNSGVSFSIGNDWQENYSGTWSGQRMWTPMLPEMLLFDANQRKQEKQFKDEVVPLIRQAYSIEAGNEFELRARLWFCEESEFLAAVQELESLKNRRGNSGSIPSSRADLVRVWSERGLKVSLDELIATYVRDMNRRNYGVDSHVVGPYLEGLLERGTAADLARAIKGLLGALLDKPEVEWREFLAANPPMPGQLRSQHVTGSPQDRIRRVNSAAGSLCSESAVLRMHIMGVLADHGFHKYESFTNLSSSYRHQSLPERASELVLAMEATPFIRDIDTFDVLEPARDGYRSGFEHLTDMIQRRGSNYSAAMVESLQKRQEKQRTFGASLMIAKLVELTPDLVLTLQPHAEAFSKEPAARQEMLLKVIRTVWADFDRQAVQSPSLAPYAAGLRQSGLAGAEKLLAAKATKDIEPNDSKYEKKLQEAVVQAVVLDPTKASQALEHGVKLLMEKQAKEGWGGSTWSNGCNLASGMLEKTCGLAGGNALRSTAPPALEIIGMALRVYEQPEQRLYLCTYREADFRWGEMMRVYWERSGGFKEPRKAVRTLLAELTRVLGTATPVLLPEAFRSMAEDVPRWNRAVILDEATTLSSGPGAEAAIARELVTGFGLISREPGVVADLKARLNDGKLHPLIRPVVAAVLTEYAMSSLSAAEVHQCLETTLPLLENSWPAATSIWAPLLNAFNLQPASPEWDALAKRFREAWMHRARFNAKGAKSGLALEMQVTVAAHVLELFARSASTEELAKFHSTYAKAIDRNVDSVLILARHNKPDLLRQVLKANDGSLTGANSTTRAIKFRSTDIAVTQVIDEAMKADARLTARGRLLAVSAPDSTAQVPKPGRAERLRLEAERFVKDRDKEKLVGDPALVVLVDTAVSAAVLLPALTTQMEWKVEMTRATRATGSTAIGELLDVPLALALAAMAQGDDKPWRQVTDAITESKAGNPGYSLWNTLSHRIATVSMRHVREQGLDKTGWVTGALRDLLNSVPTNINLEAATSMHLMNALLRGQGKELDQWRQKLPKDRQKQLVPQDALWLEYCLDAMPSFPDEDGGKTLLTVLADPWAKAATRTANDLRYRGKWPARLEDAELRQHTEALLQADPGNLAVLTTVMDSWSSQKDQKPLLVALLAVKPKLDTTKDKKALERIAAVETEAK